MTAENGNGGQVAEGGVIGLDNGVQGYACHVVGGRAIRFWPAPTYGGEGGMAWDEDAMLAQAHEWKALGVKAVYVELLTNLPPRLGGGRTNYMRGAGRWAWRIALRAAKVRWVEVPTADWKAAFGLMGEGDKAKTVAVMKARAEFPDVDLRDLARHPGAVVPCPDKAEAALLGLYGERTEAGQTQEFEAARAAWRQEAQRRREAGKKDKKRKKKAGKARKKKS